MIPVDVGEIQFIEKQTSAIQKELNYTLCFAVSF
jgi:hypothetical protein